MQGILCHIGNKHKQDFLVILSDPARQRNAVHARHFHIQKDQVYILPLHNIQCFHTVICFQSLIPFIL